MNRIPSWGWSILTIVVVLMGLAVGGRGPEGRALSRMFFPFAAILVVLFTVVSYWRERMIPTGRLRIINIAAVLAVMYLTVPLWHFGVSLPQNPGEPVVVRWWVNVVVLILAVGLYFSLSRFTKKHT